MQILLKNSVKLEGFFFAENQSNLNFSQHWSCKLTNCFVGRDRQLLDSPRMPNIQIRDIEKNIPSRKI